MSQGMNNSVVNDENTPNDFDLTAGAKLSEAYTPVKNSWVRH